MIPGFIISKSIIKLSVCLNGRGVTFHLRGSKIPVYTFPAGIHPRNHIIIDRIRLYSTICITGSGNSG